MLIGSLINECVGKVSLSTAEYWTDRLLPSAFLIPDSNPLFLVFSRDLLEILHVLKGIAPNELDVQYQGLLGAKTPFNKQNQALGQPYFQAIHVEL